MRRRIDGNIGRRLWGSPRILGLLLCLGLYPAAPCDAGLLTAADFLKISVGAEAAALGEAYTARARGANALNTNPAGIVRSPYSPAERRWGLSVSHQMHFADTSFDHFGLVLPGGPGRTSFGLNVLRLSYGIQDARDLNRNETGTFSASDLAVGLSAARGVGPVTVGVQGKLIRENLGIVSADAAAVDFGALTSPIPRLSIGAAVRNLGTRMKFINESSRLPLTMSAGGAYRVAQPLLVVCDLLSRPYQRQTIVSVGAELSPSQNVALRAGYLAKLAEAVQNNQTSETNRGSFGGITGIAGGVGVRLSQFWIDYAMTPFGELGNTQTLSLSTWFGGADVTPEAPDATSSSPAASDATRPSVAPPAPTERVILILPLSDDEWWVPR